MKWESNALISYQDARELREEIADVLLYPLFEHVGFDVEIDCKDGFDIKVIDNGLQESCERNDKTC